MRWCACSMPIEIFRLHSAEDLYGIQIRPFDQIKLIAQINIQIGICTDRNKNDKYCLDYTFMGVSSVNEKSEFQCEPEKN